MADAYDSYDDGGFLGNRLREWRHNPCLMQPASFIMISIFALFMLTTLVLQVPTLVLGLLLSPILTRSSWYVEFLYPWDIARWAHFFLIRISSNKTTKSDDKNRGFHSRAMEQKIEVVQGRIYIHPIPQWLDNLGYLIVCLPQNTDPEQQENYSVSRKITSQTIVAIMIDCGEASATIKAIEMIRQHHYKNLPFQIQAILSTHKHHDHTGGNGELMKSKFCSDITKIFAGAVEKVPHCTDPLVDGHKLDLPREGSNDMNDLVEIEAVVVPAHTRGSVVYRLSCKVPNHSEFMFTGDTMFSAGAGVPFESDIGSESESMINRSNGNTLVRAGIGSHAMERCFAEILARGMPHRRAEDAAVTEKILIFPGHEYTSELLSRQLANATNEACRWKNFFPRYFFDTASHMFVALHRRSLPHISGKLLMVPSTLDRELHISPPFRSLRKSGELVIRAIQFWYDHFCTTKGEIGTTAEDSLFDESVSPSLVQEKLEKEESTVRHWNVHPDEVGQKLFTTVYTSDLESVIEGLISERISTQQAIIQLRGLPQKLEAPVVNRRAIPGYMPSDKSIYRGIVGLVLLGSRPSAMTLKDSRTMNLPPPIDSTSDRILVSKNRLLVVLCRLGLLKGQYEAIVTATGLLWKEASKFASCEHEKTMYGDVESSPIDEIELGVLKWTIYGVPANQPSWFSKIFCMPCSKVPEVPEFPEHPASRMKQKTGDLVSHDVLMCPLCRTSTGCFREHRVEAKEAEPAEVEAVLEVGQASSNAEEGRSDDNEMGESPLEDSEVPTVIQNPDMTPTICTPVLTVPQSDDLEPLPLERRETESFNSFADYDADKNGIAKMASLQNLLKEHEP